MSTFQPLFKLSRGYASNLLKRQARINIGQKLESALEGIQTSAGKARDSFEASADRFNRQTERLSRAAQNPQQAERSAERLKDLHAERAEEDFQTQAALVALERMKLKRHFGFKATGNEYIQVKSAACEGEKHPTVKVKLPNLKKRAPRNYVNKAHDFATEFVGTLQNRSPFVSPRLAASRRLSHVPGEGRDPSIALNLYAEAWDAVDQNLQQAEDLAQNSIKTKVLKNAKFRIQLKDRHEVGNLSAKLKFDSQKASMTDHVEEGLEKATRLHNALLPEAIPRDLNGKSLISYRLLRNNFAQKHIDFDGLAHFENAASAFNTVDDADNAIIKQWVDNLQDKHKIKVKILRDKAFRITRYTQEGQATKPVVLSYNKADSMSEHIRKGLQEAQRIADNGSIPETISKTRKLINKSYPLKKKVLNFFG